MLVGGLGGMVVMVGTFLGGNNRGVNGQRMVSIDHRSVD